MPRPAKFIQPLAPNFVEVDENIVYVEPEDEFDEESSGDEMQVDTEGLTKRQIKCQREDVEVPDFDQVQSGHL